ncbi:major royal jelly protein 1 [Solenopsis invicta]|uniref:major royal jelly protein 1 n=1 Tax=Solenopsis invicta TaxID=13686 RepID=UPI000E33E6DB|nr:major royal jelly protein 1 [Solenopsis invicta]
MRCFVYVISILSIATTSFGKLHLDYQWKYIDLLWESDQQKQEAIDTGRYNASRYFLYDMDKAPDGRIFVTSLRFDGIPVSVMTVTKKQGEGGLLLRPYPDWSWYKDDCKGIRAGSCQIQIKCNHLFIVDDGKIGDNLSYHCPAQLLIFDLSTDKLVKRVEIPDNLISDKTGFGSLCSIQVIVPDCRNVKDNVIVLFGDLDRGGLVVYNARSSKMCRIENEFMKNANPNFVIANQSYHLSGNIYGMTIIGKDLYYANIEGNKIYKTEISKLTECEKNDINQANKQTQVRVLEGQTLSLTSDRCAIFFNDITKTSIKCADVTNGTISKEILVAHDPIQLQFPSGTKIRNGELLIISNRYHLFISDSYNINEINFRILSIPITDIEKDTNCFSSCNN